MDLGIISTADIARGSLIPALEGSDHDVAAISSRDADRARAVAEEYDIPRSYGSYEELFEDDGIDGVYNPLPNGLHAEWTKKAADAGLHVLCEKPLTEDAAEARDVVDHCADRGVTLMEAFMYRYHPRTERAAQLAHEELGEIRSVNASFKFPLYGRPDDVRLDPDLAGGSLMDVGCYAVSAARLFLGHPDRAYAHTDDSRDSGVDTELAGVLEYESGASARVACGFDTQLVQRYRVEATDGWIEVRDAFDAPTEEPVELEYRIDGRHAVETFDPIDQYRLEVDHFAESIETGEGPRTGGADAIANMHVIDALYESADRDAPVSVE